MVSMVNKVLAMLHARLADTRVGEDASKLRLEFLLGSLEDGVCSLCACDIACKVCHLRQKRMMLGICPQKSAWVAGMQGMIPLREANDAWNLPTKIRMGLLATLLLANDWWMHCTKFWVV